MDRCAYFFLHIIFAFLFFFFFFSSRRRHTRSTRDWSSDVCSSDLFLARALAVGAAGSVLGLAGSGVRSALGRLRVKEVPVRLHGLPAQLDGFRLAQISDLHIGALLHRGWVEGVVERVLGTRPDAVAITGDLVDGTVDELRNHVAPLAKLASVPRGVYFVTGNHEYYSGVDAWLGHLPTLGIRPLRNERLELAPGLDLAGIHDASGRGIRGYAPDLDRALAGRKEGRPLVLLAHQPRQFAEAAAKGVSLTLCGHTHGGQIWPFSWIVALVQPYLAGLHRSGDAQVYVSRGTRFWGPPMRVIPPPEVPVPAGAWASTSTRASTARRSMSASRAWAATSRPRRCASSAAARAAAASSTGNRASRASLTKRAPSAATRATASRASSSFATSRP